MEVEVRLLLREWGISKMNCWGVRLQCPPCLSGTKSRRFDMVFGLLRGFALTPAGQHAVFGANVMAQAG